MAGRVEVRPNARAVAEKKVESDAEKRRKAGIATFVLGDKVREKLVEIAKHRTVENEGTRVTQTDVLRDLIEREFAKIERKRLK